MAKLGNAITPSTSSKKIEASNKVNIAPGTYLGTIEDVWIYNVDSDGKYTKEHTDQQKVSIKVHLDGTEITLDKRMRAYLSEKAHFAKLISSLTGIEPGSQAMLDFDADDLKGARVMVCTSFKDPYTNIDSIVPAPKAAPFTQPPAADRITPEAEKAIAEIISSHGIPPMQVAEVVIQATNGGTNDYRSASLAEARDIYARLKKIASGAPF